MSSRPCPTRAGVTTGDGLLALSLLLLGAALLYPFMHRRAFDRRLDRLVGGVEALRVAAVGYMEQTGSWPPAASPGEPPAPLAGSIPTDVPLEGLDYSIEWSIFADVVIPDLPPDAFIDVPENLAVEPELPRAIPAFSSRGAITVHARDGGVLGALLQRYGPSSSFVRDTTWTLLLPGRASPGASP